MPCGARRALFRMDLFLLFGFLPPKNDLMMLLFRCVVTSNSVQAACGLPEHTLNGSGIVELANHWLAIIGSARGIPIASGKCALCQAREGTVTNPFVVTI